MEKKTPSFRRCLPFCFLSQGHPVSEKQLKEVLGHTPLQVLMGALLGIACGVWVGGRPILA